MHVVSERRQSEKTIYSVDSIYRYSGKSRTIEKINRSVDGRVGVVGGEELNRRNTEGFFLGETILHDTVKWICDTFIKTNRLLQQKE